MSSDNDYLTWRPLYASTYTTPIQSLPWPFVLFNLIVSTSTRYHYTCRFYSVIEVREDVRCLLESYVFSGGLRLYLCHFHLKHRESQEPDSMLSFLQGVFENEMSEYSLIHEWIDRKHPEPAWKRKRNPIVCAWSSNVLLFWCICVDMGSFFLIVSV